jgi:hypothetical protein
MKRYIEEKELLVLYFSAYFLYGKSKYGTLERGDVRLARIAACRGVMQVCDTLKETPNPLPRAQLEKAFALLEQQAERLAEGAFRTNYLETLEVLKKTA